ncbi:transketolase family protein [Nonomuraea sp. NPDC050227]|uniref:transketolase family protein n=1 Tax=Nonomuraea sp. NPDC050227 TaxID=3364360 RepID=UPI003791ABEF
MIGNFLRERAVTAGDTYFIKADGNLPGTESFVTDFPNFCLNVGIAEQNGMSIAGGIASTGRHAYFWNNCTFLIFRPYDQIRWDVDYANTRIRLIGTSAGYTRGPAGMAGVVIDDIGALRSMPNLTIVAPGDLTELATLLRQCHELDGPVYMRLGLERAELPQLHPAGTEIVLGRAAVLCDGDQAVLLATGHLLPEAWQLVQDLRTDGLRVRLVSMHTIKPFDQGAVTAIAAEGIPVITYEDHNIIGGLGSAAAEAIAESGHGVPFLRVGVPDRHAATSGSAEYLRQVVGFPSREQIRRWLLNRLNATT